LRARRPISPADVLLSVGLFALYVPYAYRHDASAAALVIGALNAAVLLARRFRPLETLAVCLVLSAVLSVMLRHAYPVTPADVIALYAVGRYCSRQVALGAAIATVIIGFITAEVSGSIPSYTIHNVATLGWVPVAVFAGVWMQTQRTYLHGAEERADRAEREREEEARRRVAEERLRIARELHDIVGHALMSINVTSSVSARLAVRDPETARESLRAINSVSGSALGEIRRTLSLLREGCEPAKGPGLGLADLPDLIEQTRRGGLPVTLNESGSRPEVPAIVGFTVYRIVQESLTNITRHATDVTKVAVSLTYTPESLDVAVANDGAKVQVRENAGIGIQGMRERAAATGGRLDTTTLPTGGFRVHARLPLKESSP
jgi:signal transduction histidine kinase